jgi:hypothetical protein
MTSPLDREPAALQPFRVFDQIVPRDLLEPLQTGHQGIFSPWVIVWLMVFQRLHQNASLSRAVAELRLGEVAESLPDCKRVRDGAISVNTGGYSQARSDLPLDAAVRVTDHVFETLAASQKPAWVGRRAFLLDGTTLSATNTPELVDCFPPGENQHGRSHWPVVHLVTAHDLASGFAARPEWGAMYGPQAVSEATLCRRLLGRLGPPAVILADRNFGIFSVAHAAARAGHDVVFRLKDDRWDRMVAAAVPAGPGQWLLEWRPSRWDRKAHPELPADAVVRGRLIEVTVERDGESVRLRLFTTEMTAAAEEAADFYALRWTVETDIRDVKQTLQLHRPSGRSVDIVSKEILLGVVAYNLVIQVRRMAAGRAGIEPRRLSFKRVLDLVQAYCGGLSQASDVNAWADRFERLLDSAAQCRLPVRKKARSYPREVIPRYRGFPSRPRKTVDKNTK